MASPIILFAPGLTIGGKDLKCLMSHIELNPELEIVEVKTACGVTEYAGSVKWTLRVSLYHSWAVDETNDVLTDAVTANIPVAFTCTGNSGAPISATNPTYTGMLIPRPFTPLSGDVGAASSVDLEWSIDGWGMTPTLDTSP